MTKQAKILTDAQTVAIEYDENGKPAGAPPLEPLTPEQVEERKADLLRAVREEYGLSKKLAAAEARAKRLEDALRFYANDDNWGPTPVENDEYPGQIFEISAIEQDEGNIARAALLEETKA